MLGQTLSQLLPSRIDDVLVVTGFMAAAVAQAAQSHGVRTLYNPDYASGEMLSSLGVAIRALSAACSGLLVVLADQPLITTAVYDQVIAAFAHDEQRIVAPVFAGRRGHPVLFGRSFFAGLLALPPGSAPRHLLQAHANALRLVPVDSEAVLIDLDRPGDYERYRPPFTTEESDAQA